MGQEPNPGEKPLDERKERILREIVESYVAAGEPVGSRVISDAPEMNVSSATIRNEMGILEREGYISQPHTSAGRIPTDKGYRYYVDELAPSREPDPERLLEVEGLLAGTLSAMDELLMKASSVLSELTNYTSLASAPPAAEARLRHVQLIGLGGRRVFAVLVGEGAWHAERVIELPSEPSEEALRQAGEKLNRLVDGLGLTAAADAVDAQAGHDGASPLMEATAQILRSVAAAAHRVYAGGTSRLIVWEPAPIARRVLEMLEGGQVEPLLPEPSAEGVSVRIGHELALDDYHDLSLIAAGYRLGRQAGTLGVLGPTRMDYPTVIATVADVAQSLSKALQRLEGQ